MALDILKFIKGILIKNDGDTSKQVELNVSNTATTATKTTIVAAQTANRTITLPDQTGTLATDNDLALKADQDLSNLTPTSINESLVPDSDSTKSVGDPDFMWASGYFNSLRDTNDNLSISVSGRTLNTTTEDATVDYENKQLKTAGTIKLDWSATDVSLNTRKLTNVTDPSLAQDAATKNYVDTQDANKVTGPASSVDGEIALFDATTGKLIKRATGTGPVKATSGVYSTGNINLASEVTGTLPIANGGTGQTSQTAAFDALAPTTVKGDIIVHNGTDNIRLAVGTDGTVLVADSTQASGLKFDNVQGVKNYITNPGADSSTNGWVTYKDADQATPVDGTGGTANITLLRWTVAPLRGPASFLIVKDAANRRGEGVSFDFTIDAADRAKVLQISLDYEIAVGTTAYADGDLTAYIYDVTNGTVIQPAGFSFSNVVGMGQLKATFQTASNSTSYRLIFHFATTYAGAQQIKFDNVIVGPQVVTQGAAMTDFRIRTCTLTNAGNATVSAVVKQVGDYAEFVGIITMGSSLPTGQIILNLPAGMSVDLSKTANLALGIASASNSGGTGSYTGTVRLESPTSVVFYGDSNANVWTGTVPRTFANLDRIDFSFKVAIAGWSSNTQVSSDTDTRVVAMKVTQASPTATITSTMSKLTFTATPTFDTHGAFNTSTGNYTCPVPGYYKCIGSLLFTAASSAVGNNAQLGISRNNAAPLTQSVSLVEAANNVVRQVSHEEVIYCNAGDTLAPFVSSTMTSPFVFGSAPLTFFSVERLSGPSQIAASESVSARYKTAAGQSIGITTGDAVDFGTKDWDSHNAVTNPTTDFRFYAPISGEYQINTSIRWDGSFTSNNVVFQRLYKNGIAGDIVNLVTVPVTGATNNLTVAGSIKIKLLAGEYIQLYALHQEGTARNLFANAISNWIEINRVGNY